MIPGRKVTLRRSASIAALLLGASLVGAANAQESSGEAPQPEASKRLTTVTVTAQKREESAQDIPVAVSVLDEDALENLDVKGFEDVARVSPSLSIETGDEPSNSTIRMRGIGTAAYSIAAEPSVAVVVDGVPLMVTAQAFSNLQDIQRIEVLKGPQGTLFGKNASAGVVSIVTQDPTDEFEAKLGLRATDDEEFKGNISLSGPISDTLSYRLNAYAIDREGYLNNLEDGSKLGGEESHGFRGKLLWRPTDALDVNLILDMARRDSSSGLPFIALPANDPGRELIVAGPDSLDVQLDSPNGFETENDMGVVKLDYSFDDFVLTSVSSYQRYSQSDILDSDNSAEPIAQNPFLNPTGAPPGTPNIESVSDRESTSFSQELRLTTTGSGPLQYMIGAWYSDVEHERSFDRCCFRFLLTDFDAVATNESMALFGQGSYEFARETFFDFGLRLNREEISVDFTNQLATPSVNYTGSDSEDAITGKVALRHFLDNGAMIYGAVSTGYKGKAYDVSSSFTAADAESPVDSESSISYEAGFKGTTDDGTFRYDVVAFLTDFEDYQAQGAVPQPAGDVEFSLNNVGELQTKGVEANFNWQATDSLRLDFSGALVDAKIEAFPFADCYFGQTEAEGCNVIIDTNNDGVPEAIVQDLAGADLNNSPDFKFNVGAFFEQEVPNMPFDWFLQGNYQWQDDVNFDLFGAPTNKQDAYGIANVSVGISEPDGRYRLSLFVNNLFDELYYSRIDDTTNRRDDGQLQIAVQRLRDSRRYAGVKMDFTF